MQAEAVFDAKAFCASLPSQPGVYRMMNSAGQVIYVGKAIDLQEAGFFLFSEEWPGVPARNSWFPRLRESRLPLRDLKQRRCYSKII